MTIIAWPVGKRNLRSMGKGRTGINWGGGGGGRGLGKNYMGGGGGEGGSKPLDGMLGPDNACPICTFVF